MYSQRAAGYSTGARTSIDAKRNARVRWRRALKWPMGRPNKSPRGQSLGGQTAPRFSTPSGHGSSHLGPESLRASVASVGGGQNVALALDLAVAKQAAWSGRCCWVWCRCCASVSAPSHRLVSKLFPFQQSVFCCCLTRRNLLGPDGVHSMVLWRPEALDCRVLIQRLGMDFLARLPGGHNEGSGVQGPQAAQTSRSRQARSRPPSPLSGVTWPTVLPSAVVAFHTAMGFECPCFRASACKRASTASSRSTISWVSLRWTYP